LSLCSEYGIDPDSREVEKGVNDLIADLVDEIGGKDNYKKFLSDNKLTDAFLRLMYKISVLEKMIVEEMTERGELEYSENNLGDFVNFVVEDESYVKVIHAFYPKDWSYSNGKGAKQNAESALEEISGAYTDKERFSRMRSAIGNAPFVSGYSVMGSDYYITYGQMHKLYESVAFSLDEYEASGIIELDEGYYILMRVPKEKSEVGPRANEFIANYAYALLKQRVDAKNAGISFESNEYFDSLELVDIK
jgi:hypothetical protein